MEPSPSETVLPIEDPNHSLIEPLDDLPITQCRSYHTSRDHPLYTHSYQGLFVSLQAYVANIDVVSIPSVFYIR